MSVKIHLLFAVALGVFNLDPVYGHDETDWRSDFQAYASYNASPVVPLFIRFDYPDLKIDPADLKARLDELSGVVDVTIGGKPVRISERGSESGRQLTRRYLAQEFQKLGFMTSEHQYKGGANFLAQKAGTDPSKTLIISAHFDSVSNAGADDDGTGVVALMVVAKALKDMTFRHNLLVIGFDQEERGLVGSRYYVNQLENPGSLIGNIQFEMSGYNGSKEGAFHLIDCDRTDSIGLSAHMINAIRSLNLPLKRTSACTDRSDHASFWDRDIGAIAISENFFGGDANPCYHRSCDNTGLVDFEYFGNIVRAFGSAVAVILEAAL